MELNTSERSFDFKVFLQGENIRASYISVDPRGFRIEIPPINEGLRIKPNTYCLVAFSESGGPLRLLCEGFYNGPNYSKTPQSRKLSLTFQNIRTFIRQSKFFDLIRESSAGDNFVTETRRFMGDVREETEVDEEISGEMKESIRLQFINAINEDLGEALKWLIDSGFKNNPFLDKHSQASHLGGNRYKVIQNNFTSEIFTHALITHSLSNILNEYDSLTPVEFVIQKTLELVEYEQHIIPGMLDKDLTSYIIMPKMAVSIPPACNVVFPHESISINYHKQFDQISTRYRLRGDFNREDGNLGEFYAPKEMYEILKEDVGKFLTDEEKMWGITPNEEKTPFTRLIASGALEGKREYNAKLTNYLFYLNKYKTIPLSVNTPFKPDILPGLNCLVLDDELSLIGNLQSFTHHIDFKSPSISTSLTLSHMRPAHENIPVLNGWFDPDQFTPVNIGSKIFSKLNTKSCFFKNNEEVMKEKRELEARKEEAQKNIPSPPEKRTVRGRRRSLEIHGLEEDQEMFAPGNVPNRNPPIVAATGEYEENEVDVLSKVVHVDEGVYIYDGSEMVFIPHRDLGGMLAIEKLSDPTYEPYSDLSEYLDEQIKNLNRDAAPYLTEDNELHFEEPIRELLKMYHSYGDYKSKFRDSFKRELPEFEDILETLNLELKQGKIYPKEGDNPLEVDLKIEGQTVSEIRREAAKRLANRFGEGPSVAKLIKE